MRKRTLTILANGQRVVADNLTFRTNAEITESIDIASLSDAAFAELTAKRDQAKVQRDAGGVITGIKIGKRLHHLQTDNQSDSKA